MDTSLVLDYRRFVIRLINLLRNSVFNSSNSFPRDKELAGMLGISQAAFSSLASGKSSASGVVLFRLLCILHKYGYELLPVESDDLPF